MSSCSYVEKAQRMSVFAEDVEFARVGDRDIARANLGRKYGIAPSFLRKLRYYPPKQIAADLYHKLCLAVEDAALRQIHIAESLIVEAKSSRKGVSESTVASAETTLLEIIAILREGIEQ